MGALNNHYCDSCAVEMREVKYRSKLVEVGLSPDAVTVDVELCGTCYSKLRKLLGDRKEAAAASWAPAEVVEDPLDTTTL